MVEERMGSGAPDRTMLKLPLTTTYITSPVTGDEESDIAGDEDKKKRILAFCKEGFKFANQKYALLALAGLYQIMVYFYQKIASIEKRRIVTPIPGSRIFKLIGGMWDSIDFYGDSALYIDENGNLIWETSMIHY